MSADTTLRAAAHSSSLRIAVLGAGNIGSAFAFQLSRVGGHHVTVIARPGSTRWQQLENDRAIVLIGGERASVHVASMLDEQVPYDLVIVTLLTHQMLPLLPVLQRSAAGCVQFMANTFQPERLQEAIGAERCSFGMPFVQAKLSGDGMLKMTIGAGGQKTIMGQQRWVDLFNAAGLPAVLEPDMPLWLRCHGVHACFGLVEALGYPIYPRAKNVIKGSPAWLVAAVLWIVSKIRSFRELLATGEAECRALADVMIAAVPL